MGDQQYNKLKQRIGEVFDDYDDNSADAGWLLLREKFPQQKRRLAVLWIWSAAAVLLLFIGFAIRMYITEDQQADNKKISYRVKTIQLPKIASQPQKNVITSQQKADNLYTNPGKSGYKTVAGYVAGVKSTNANPAVNTSAAKQNNLIMKLAFPVNSPIAHLSKSATAQQMNQIAAETSDSANKTSLPYASNLVTDAQQKSTVPDTLVKTVVIAEPKNTKTITEMFAADKDKADGGVKVKKVNRVLFGVYASTYFNSAKGSKNQVNAGGGFTADITLTGNLKLVSGLSVNQNSFAYNNSGGFYTNFPASTIFGDNNSSGNITYTKNASLIGLDIPLDLKYVLTSRKNQLYVLAGVGSGTFINESYGYVYSDGTTASSMQSGKGFNNFYFARTMNIAFGLGYPLGNNQIVIEPFIKYPLQGLGAEQLRFSASGINLKFNFSIKK